MGAPWRIIIQNEFELVRDPNPFNDSAKTKTDDATYLTLVEQEYFKQRNLQKVSLRNYTKSSVNETAPTRHAQYVDMDRPVDHKCSTGRSHANRKKNF